MSWKTTRLVLKDYLIEHGREEQYSLSPLDSHMWCQVPTVMNLCADPDPTLRGLALEVWGACRMGEHMRTEVVKVLERFGGYYAPDGQRPPQEEIEAAFQWRDQVGILLASFRGGILAREVRARVPDPSKLPRVPQESRRYWVHYGPRTQGKLIRLRFGPPPKQEDQTVSNTQWISACRNEDRYDASKGFVTDGLRALQLGYARIVGREEDWILLKMGPGLHYWPTSFADVFIPGGLSPGAAL